MKDRLNQDLTSGPGLSSLRTKILGYKPLASEAKLESVKLSGGNIYFFYVIFP
jgi:hypothetical protein